MGPQVMDLPLKYQPIPKKHERTNTAAYFSPTSVTKKQVGHQHPILLKVVGLTSP
jgi:hypothetical protein